MRTTFLVLDEGEYEEETGYWVMDQATQEEGFVSLFSETEFWVLGAKDGYTKRKIHRAHTYKDGCRRAASDTSKPIATPKPKAKSKTKTDPDVKVDAPAKTEIKEEPISLRQHRLASLFRCLRKRSKIRHV